MRTPGTSEPINCCGCSNRSVTPAEMSGRCTGSTAVASTTTVHSTSTVGDALEAVGLDRSHALAFDDDSWDREIEKRMAAGLELTGDDVGTPIIGFENRDGEKRGYFGPVITRVPTTEDSLAMWDGLVAMMNIEGFWELKRTRTERPDFGQRP